MEASVSLFQQYILENNSIEKRLEWVHLEKTHTALGIIILKSEFWGFMKSF